jgi:hypothetical protein
MFLVRTVHLHCLHVSNWSGSQQQDAPHKDKIIKLLYDTVFLDSLIVIRLI